MVYKGYSVVYEGCNMVYEGCQGCIAVQDSCSPALEDCRGLYGCVMVWLQTHQPEEWKFWPFGRHN